MNEKKYYIAYGSNLSVEQMAQRCPDARIVGQAVLEDWELAFHGCATILPNKGKNTPVLVWEISAGDEKNLDIKALEKIAPIKRISTEEIFGY